MALEVAVEYIPAPRAEGVGRWWGTRSFASDPTSRPDPASGSPDVDVGEDWARRSGDDRSL